MTTACAHWVEGSLSQERNREKRCRAMGVFTRTPLRDPESRERRWRAVGCLVERLTGPRKRSRKEEGCRGVHENAPIAFRQPCSVILRQEDPPESLGMRRRMEIIRFRPL